MTAPVPAVVWRDGRVAESPWTALVQPPGINVGFRENGVFAFTTSDRGWSFRIDDEPLPVQGGETPTWQWQPGFFAGEVTAELVAPDGHCRALFLLDVSPHPDKLGRDTFEQMMTELWDEDPSSVLGTEPATTRVGDVGPRQNLWLEFSRLRRHLPLFLQALSGIRAKPRRTLEVRRTSSPLHRVRTADRYTALSLARSAAVEVVFEEEEPGSSLSGNCRLDVSVVRETLDSAANRAMLSLVLSVLHRSRALRRDLAALVEREARSETRTALDPRWPPRRDVLDGASQALKRVLRLSPLSDAGRAEVTAAGLTAVAADPVYARAWGQGWRILRRGLESGEREERLWVSPSWAIYERWCFLRVGKALRAEMPDWHWRRDGAERWLGSDGTRHAELQLQPRFPAYTDRPQRTWSVSREREPDILLNVRDSGGLRFVTLDAKYRVSREGVLDAMASAHIYQDSLRMGTTRSSASLLLVPAPGGAPWLEEPGFHAAHRVGVHAFCPGGDCQLPGPVLELFQ